MLTALGIAAVYFEHWLTPFGDLGEWAWFLGFFGAGMVLHFLRDRLSWDWRYALLALLALVMVAQFHFASGAMFQGSYITGQNGLVYLLIYPVLIAGRAGIALGLDGILGRSLGRSAARPV